MEEIFFQKRLEITFYQDMDSWLGWNTKPHPRAYRNFARMLGH
jgi:hypothetical protein